MAHLLPNTEDRFMGLQPLPPHLPFNGGDDQVIQGFAGHLKLASPEQEFERHSSGHWFPPRLVRLRHREYPRTHTLPHGNHCFHP